MPPPPKQPLQKLQESYEQTRQTAPVEPELYPEISLHTYKVSKECIYNALGMEAPRDR